MEQNYENFQETNEININEWKEQNDLIGCFQCLLVNSDGTKLPGYIENFSK